MASRVATFRIQARKLNEHGVMAAALESYMWCRLICHGLSSFVAGAVRRMGAVRRRFCRSAHFSASMWCRSAHGFCLSV